MHCELSIIVPVYNAGIYIERTVKSLLTQNIDNYEIILIDDGSSDSSAQICDRLSSTYPNIRTYHFKNSGPGASRNKGITLARGKYIAFCDADDLPDPNMYGTLLSDLKNTDSDFSLCDIFSERDNCNLGFPWNENIKFSGNSIVTEFMASMLGNASDNDSVAPVWGSSVRGIYKHNIISEHDIKFPEDIRFAEDLVFNIRYIKRINSCYVRNEALYRYTFNKTSLMSSHVKYNSNTFAEHLKLIDYILYEINSLHNNFDLLKRFATSQRCYFIECAGNAARSIKDYGYGYALREMKSIVRHERVREAYHKFDASQFKKRLSYSLMKGKCALLLLIYFAIRLR